MRGLPPPQRRRWRNATLAALLLAVGLLFVPMPEAPIGDAPPAGRPFVWNRDSVWQSLEQAYVRTRAAGCADTSQLDADLSALEDAVAQLRGPAVSPSAPLLDSIESRFHALAPRVAACPRPLERYVAVHAQMRRGIKEQSREWDVQAPAARDRLYRALYGGRAAVEEVMLQHPARVATLLQGVPEPSAAPASTVHGVQLHSGDILVSRGGYPTSALIARGSDYPGNFSHVGLVHIEADGAAVSVIEAHIALGVTVTSAEQYLADKKLRLMVLRPRAGLPQLRREPMLPHLAASSIRDRALREHIRYDFAMDYRDPNRLFCSEVASAAYGEHGITLWTGISTITREGLRHWLGAFGVRHFETQEPSDLEYDPQLVVVAEWHDPALLFDDHVDNAVTDAMLEGADRGDRLGYPWYMLPVARVMKGYSMVRELFGSTGPIPQGMSAPAALRNRRYGARHAELAAMVHAAAAVWQREHGYVPTYWTLVELARDAVSAGVATANRDAT